MSDSKLYTIELGGDLGDIAIMHRLVRCKECRHMYEHAGACGIQLLCNLHTCFHVGPEGFCAWGDEREDRQCQ